MADGRHFEKKRKIVIYQQRLDRSARNLAKLTPIDHPNRLRIFKKK